MAIIKSTSARRTSTVKSTASKSASSKTAASKSTSNKSSGTLNSNGYRDNFDYSAAIAGTTDSAKRQQLLSERQNKIDSLVSAARLHPTTRFRRGTATTVRTRFQAQQPVQTASAACMMRRKMPVSSDLRPPAAALQGSWRTISHPSRTTTLPVCVRPTSMPDSPR